MKGFIGYFDILGYQNFLINNSAKEPIDKVLKIIQEMPNEILKISSKVIEETADTERKTHKKMFHDNFKHYVFSDTIVFTLEFPEEIKDEWYKGALIHISGCCARLVGNLFENGLPVSGVIHEGEFFSEKMSLAGKGIVEAYQLCNKLNYSGLSYSEFLSAKIIKSHNELYYELLMFRYLAPRKMEEDLPLLNINWVALHFTLEEFQTLPSNVEQHVFNAFWAHQKDCPSSVDIKIYNTIKSIRKMIYIIQLNESKFKDLKDK